jgi:fluoride exporter
MNSLFPVMVGGALGAGLRYGAGAVLGGRLPWGTFVVNLLGGFLMGLLMALLIKGGASENGASEGVRLFIGVGLLGGFTTFSAFSLDLWQMVARGQNGLAIGYALASVIGSVVLLFAGLSLGKALT